MRRAAVVRSVLSLFLVVAIISSGAPVVSATDELILQTQHVLEQPAGSNHRFGEGVALSGDTAVIGAPGAATSAGSNRGAAHVYVRTPSGWVHQATLAASDGASGDFFGNTVAIDGDTIAVGAIYADPRGENSGAAYVFTRSGTTWTQRAKLVPSDSAAGDYCGGTLAVSGTRVFVGAIRHNGGRGAVWQFAESAGSWTQTHKFSEDLTANSWYGSAIAIAGARLLIGARFADRPSALGAGRVYTYRSSGDDWVDGGILEASLAGGNASFGSSLAFDGSSVVVGSPGWFSGEGAVYIFDAPTTVFGTRWTQTQMLTVGSPAQAFGTHVGLHGGRILSTSPHVEKAYLYTKPDPDSGTWAPEGEIGPDPSGGSYAFADDTVLVGKPSDSTVENDGGSAYFVTLRRLAEDPGDDPPPPGDDPRPLTAGAHRVSGDNRYLTAVAASKRAFSAAETVVVATGDNWPDALGGSALAGAVDGPLLLTQPASLPAEVRREIERLGAKKVYVLGGASAVSEGVLGQLRAIKGVATVKRLAGGDRYSTARAIADEAIKEMGGSYSGGALVSTGGNFPDATAASPLAASLGWPILLVNPAGQSVYVPSKTTRALILGGTGVVPASVESSLKARPGMAGVDRAGGTNRYETAAKVAEKGVKAGMRWDGVGLATGNDFPDALAGGAMLGALDSVMLLTESAPLDGHARTRLQSNASAIRTMHVIGGEKAVSSATMSAAKSAAKVP